jgi:LacI family transcriptional regulator
MARAIQESKSAAIDLWAGVEGVALPTVGVDNESLSEMAFTHLRDRGYRNFAYYGPPKGEQYYYDMRCIEYLRVLRKHGYDNCAVYAHPEGSVPTDWDLARTHLASWVSNLPRPTAIMACHDDVGLQLLEACHDAGVSVPEEIAVLGVNNDEFLCSLSNPPLSSVDMGAEHIGYESAALLDRMMHGEKISRLWTLFPPRGVVVRQSTDVASVNDPVVARAIRFIRDHACRGLQVDQLLRHSATSRTALYRRFKEQLGRSPKEEITRVRLERAQDLLKRTKLSIAQVASRTGYAESKYFIEVFARETGMTPLTFRKLGEDR